MENFPIFIVAFLAFDLLVLLLVIFRKRKLPRQFVAKIERHLRELHKLAPKDQVLQGDKILDAVLKARNFSGGTLGERMKNAQSSQALWDAHKLRNKIAHEINFTPGERSCRLAAQTFAKEIRKFLR